MATLKISIIKNLSNGSGTIKISGVGLNYDMFFTNMTSKGMRGYDPIDNGVMIENVPHNIVRYEVDLEGVPIVNQKSKIIRSSL